MWRRGEDRLHGEYRRHGRGPRDDGVERQAGEGEGVPSSEAVS